MRLHYKLRKQISLHHLLERSRQIEEVCRTELVVIGQYWDEFKVREALEQALLYDEELDAGPAVWSAFEDPLEVWEESCEGD